MVNLALVPCYLRTAPLLMCALLLTGCETAREYSLTCKLWTDPEKSRFAEPASEPHLALYHDGSADQVLVTYDEHVESAADVRRRAFFLEANLERLAAKKKPKFVKADAVAEMLPIPQTAPPAGTIVYSMGQTLALNAKAESEPVFPAPAPSDGSGTMASPEPRLKFFRGTGSEFSLLRYAVVDGPYTLPMYAARRGVVVRSALTPFAVAGDVALVGIAASVVTGFQWFGALVR